MSHKRVSTQKTITPMIPQTRLNTQYPSEWFLSNKNIKPTVHIKKHHLSKENLRQSIVKDMSDGNLNRDVIKAYLALMATEISCLSDKDWTSYNIQICKSGTVVKISDIIDIKTTDESIGQITLGSSTQDAPDYDILLVLLSLHRMSRLSPYENIDTFIDNIKQKLENKHSRVYKNIERIAKYIAWRFDKDYDKLVAAYDMFMYRFPRHKWAGLRYGSLSTRYYECAGLTSVEHVLGVLGMDRSELPDWIFHRGTLDEIEKLFANSDLDESINPFSYFPYQVDLGLVVRSSYSSVAVSDLFFLMHAVGCFMRSDRSINAWMHAEGNIRLLIKNALIIACAFKSLNNDQKNEHPDTIMSRSATEALKFMERRRFKSTLQMIRMLEEYQREITHCRGGTIGKFIANYILSD